MEAQASYDVIPASHPEYKIVNIEDFAMTADRVVAQARLIQDVMEKIMKKDEHFGTIPGTNKPSLYKPGAEKLSVTFRLVPRYEVKQVDLQNGHREYQIICTLIHAPTGQFFGQGVGSCSTMESKYRYRNVADYEVTDNPIPKDAKERKAEYRKQGYGMKKVEGEWKWVQYKDAARQENPDIADTYNTVLKMAKKRAHVDAVLTATAASDIFTQDIEDMPEFSNGHKHQDEIPDHKPTEKPKQKITKKELTFIERCASAKQAVGQDFYYQLLGTMGFEHCTELPEDQQESFLNVLREQAKINAKKAKETSAMPEGM